MLQKLKMVGQVLMSSETGNGDLKAKASGQGLKGPVRVLLQALILIHLLTSLGGGEGLF